MRERRCAVRLTVALAVVAATITSGCAAVAATAGTEDPSPVSAAHHVPDLGSLDLRAPASRVLTPAASRTRARGMDLPLTCPTTAAPGCRLSFIKDDAGWRIHPLYGYHSCHTGIDLRGGYGAKIHAAAAGRVIAVIHGDPAYGNVTLIQDDDRMRTMYAHQSRIQVTPGEVVEQGQVIGRIGATGFATGPHLHFEVHIDGRPYDPDGWFGAATKHPSRATPG